MSKEKPTVSINLIETSLKGVLLIENQYYPDDRGFFMETYNFRRYEEKGFERTFVQDNLSYSKQHVLRGLHYQLKRPQGKLVFAVRGEIFDVAVDIRRGSPKFGDWFGAVLSEENKRQIFIPEGYAHGFCVLSERADVIYKCTDFYTSGDEYGILWSDPDIGIDWPIKQPILSEKDKENPRLQAAPQECLPVYDP